ncbi:AAA family ATPase [Lysinibacillus fusiformis]|uniref:AAA family ATPase n=1 Tax=Lysinibacillus fusiformis TaxID=28031 RepID=UPI0019684C63|nr:AAA family ATPase [Lysinibacillus fusiformis]QSB09094.1 AAA family ATPase [Lysinibacillus fusiformis]
MEMLYIWIENYGPISKQSLNFGDENTYYFEDNILKSRKNPFYLEKFFSLNSNMQNKNNITNITGIVGENGVGKTTLLFLIIKILERHDEFLMDTFPEKLTESNNKYFAIFKSNNKYYLYNPFLIQINNQTNMKFEEKMKKTILTKQVFVSTVLNGSFIEETVDSTQNMSTAYLIKKGLNKYKSNNIKWNLQLINEINSQDTSRYIFSKVKVPEELTVKLMGNYFDNFPSFFIERKSIIEDFHRENDITKFKINLILNFAKIIIQFIKNRNIKDLPSELLSIHDNKLLEDLLKENIDTSLKKYFHTFDQGEINNSSAEYEMCTWIIELNELLLSYINSNYIEVISDQEFKFSTRSPYLKSFIDKNTKITDDIFEFRWRSLSSGEEIILNLFSRIFESLSKVKYQNSKIIYLLIDEIENNLHPQWQKEILYGLIKFIEQQNLNLSIQIIITSHSPFILSDLPHNNVILLEKNNDFIRRLTVLENNERTFAGNIHTLYTNSFFIKDGLISKFASEKIKDYYYELMNFSEEEFMRNKEIINNFIQIIGEPLIRNKFNSLYEEKSKVNSLLKDPNLEINQLKLEIDKLKNMIHQLGGDRDD